MNVTLDISSLKVCPNEYRLIHLLHKYFIYHFFLKHPFTYPPYKITYFFFICSTLRPLFLMECEIDDIHFFPVFNKFISLKSEFL